MFEIMVHGRDGDTLEVNGIGRGALSPAGKLVPVDPGWVQFDAIAPDGSVHAEEPRYIQPLQNPPVDLQ